MPLSASAVATATAYNLRTVFLTSPPFGDLPPACVSRSIYLAAGSYAWELYFDHTNPTNSDTNRSIYLGAGTYKWTDCIVGDDDGFYRQKSDLTPPSAATAELSTSLDFASTSGDVTVGSILSPELSG